MASAENFSLPHVDLGGPAALIASSSQIITVTPTWLFWYWNVNTLITLCVNWFSMGIIRFGTPKAQGKYRWLLMNMQFWIFVCDMGLTMSMRPVSLYPLLGFYSDGLMSRIVKSTNSGRFSPIAVLFFNNFGAAVTCCFIYRLLITYPKNPFTRNGKRLFLSTVIFHITTTVPNVVVLFLTEPTRATMEEYLQMLNLQWVLEAVPAYVIFIPGHLSASIFLWSLATLFSFFIGLSLFAYTATYIRLKTMKLTSEKSHAADEQLLVLRRLGVQACLPLLICSIPITSVVVMICNQMNYVQAGFYVCVLVVGARTHMNLFLLLRLYPYYHLFVRSLPWRLAKKWKKLISRKDTVIPEHQPQTAQSYLV